MCLNRAPLPSLRPGLSLRGACAATRCPNTSIKVRSSSAILFDLHDQVIPYEQAWEWQKARALSLADAAVAGEALTLETCQCLLILQHEPTYTLGTGSTTANLKFEEDKSPFPLFRTERGGEVTYHGPGQLVVYPILNLRDQGKDLHKYLRQLEEVIIRSLDAVSGIHAFRVDGRTGVWTKYGKIAATGVRASRWVSYHGIALNVCPNLSHFDEIVPCGIADAAVTSVAEHLNRDFGLIYDMREHTMSQQMLQEYSYAIEEAFQDVFNVDIIPGGTMLT